MNPPTRQEMILLNYLWEIGWSFGKYFSFSEADLVDNNSFIWWYCSRFPLNCQLLRIGYCWLLYKILLFENTSSWQTLRNIPLDEKENFLQVVLNKQNWGFSKINQTTGEYLFCSIRTLSTIPYICICMEGELLC